MSKVIRLDDETLGTIVNGKFVFAYDWVIVNTIFKNPTKEYPLSLIEKTYELLIKSDKYFAFDLMDIIKKDFLTYENEKDWKHLLIELEKEYKECLTR